MTFPSLGPPRANTLAPWLIAAGIAFWGLYFLVQKLPLTGDEAYFAHVSWLLRHGARQYVDFYSNHLPLYFQAIGAILPAGEGVAFVWWLRALSLLVVVAYAFMLRPALWPFLLIFLTLGRMVEIRPDTIGLLLFNAAWLVLLKDPRKLLWAAGLAALALLFSARAAVMMVPMAGLCLILARHRPWPLLGLGAAFVAGIGLIALIDLAWFLLVVRSVYLEPAALLAGVPFTERFLWPERLILVAMIAAALIAALLRIRRGEGRAQDAVIAVATASQLALIALDPGPYEYVYGWAMIPTLIGLPGTPVQRAAAPLALALAIVALAAAYPLLKGRAPRQSSFLYLGIERPLSGAEVRAMPTTTLIPLLYDRHALWNQLRVRDEICRRVRGKVLANFWYQPICLPDALHDWIGITWPKGFDRLHRDPPALLIWGERGRRPVELLHDYEEGPGFAFRKGPYVARF